MKKRSTAWWRRCFLAALTGSSGNRILALDPGTVVEHAKEIADEAYDMTPRRKRKGASSPRGPA